jgi:ring-1,2-phenylacetyl-CoA epoxidase subunit PaaE
MHLTFHPLTIIGREAVAEDAVCLRLAVPPALREDYRFEPGQHIAVRVELGGREQRRTYSIVNSVPGAEIRLGIRVQGPGGVSHYLAREARVGDSLEALSPTGRFVHTPLPAAARSYLAFAAGSGITPVLSIASAVLEQEPESRITLIYGNRTIARTMFLEELLALKNRYLARFSIHFVMSREPQDVALLNGRLDAAKVRELAAVLFEARHVDEVFVCGPGDMVTATRELLRELGMQAPVHVERFAAGIAARVPAAEASERPRAPDGDATLVTVVQDGRRRTFDMLASDASVLDAAGRAGLDLPFSCRAGVCSTCRAKVVRGAVTMAHNVALEDWELAAGYVLCCQSRPTTRELELSYDEK